VCRTDVVVFGYGKGPNGPDHWSSLKPDWKSCNGGKAQSPIDIVKDDATYTESLSPLTRDYIDANATLVNNGFDVEVCDRFFSKSTLNHANEIYSEFWLAPGFLQLRYEEGVGTVLVDGKNYSLQQLHWHTPSEHTIDGERYGRLQSLLVQNIRC